MNLVSSIFFVLAAVLEAHSLLDNLKCPPVTIPRGRVRLRSRGRIAKYSCIKGYQLLGEKYSTCLRGRWDTPPPVCISTGCPSMNRMLNAQVLESYRGALVKIQCDPGYKLTGSSSLYCNGRSWNDTLPSCEEIKYSVQNWCDFESEDLCGWTHDQNHDFDWKRHNFATPSGHVGTGPAFDHTFGPGHDGYYMYLETSSPRLENDTARLFSPEYPPSKNNNSCFLFWYHMYGATTGSLHVYLWYTHITRLLFSEYGNHGNHWIKGIIPLPFMPTSFQIIIEGVRGRGYVGDTAIDDVKLADGDECSDSGQGVSTQTTGVMPFSSNISSEHMTVAPITSFPLFSLNVSASSQYSVFTDKLQFHTATVIADENFSENPLIINQTKNQNLSSFRVYNISENQTTSPLKKNSSNYENDSNTLNVTMTYFPVLIPLNHTLLPVLKNGTGNYNGKTSTSFALFNDSVPYYITNETEARLKRIQPVIHMFTQPFVSSQSLLTNKTVTKPVSNTVQHISENSTWKKMVTKSFNQMTLLPSDSVLPTTVSTSAPVNSRVSSPTLIKSKVTDVIYKRLFPPSLPKANNDVLYPIWVKPAYITHKSFQPTSESKLTSAMHTISLPGSKRNSYISVTVLLTTVPYKRTNATHKFFVYATPSKWISKYTSKGKVEKFSAQSSSNMIVGIGTVLGVVMLILVGTGAAVLIIRKRKISRRNNLDNGESDYLTSDEVLDLTWCGPAQPIQQECTIHNN